MARRLRIQYSDAIYHVMARGNGRQDIVQDDADRGRLVACLERSVRRSGWSLYAFVFLTNHLHLVLRRLAPTSPRACNCSSRRTPMGGLVATAIAGTSSRALPDRAGRGRDVSLGSDPLRPSQPRPGRPVRDAGGLDLVELPRVFPPPRSPGLGGLRRVACGLGGEFGRTDPEASYRRLVAAGLTTRLPPRGPRHGMDGSSAVSDSWIVCASASAIRPIATRRERRLLRGLDLDRVTSGVQPTGSLGPIVDATSVGPLPCRRAHPWTRAELCRTGTSPEANGRVILDPEPAGGQIVTGTKAAVVAAWPDQPEAIRAGILAMVKAASK